MIKFYKKPLITDYATSFRLHTINVLQFPNASGFASISDPLFHIHTDNTHIHTHTQIHTLNILKDFCCANRI